MRTTSLLSLRGIPGKTPFPLPTWFLKKLHAWSRENGLAINPSKCEAAWFTLSTHTESDYDREGKWPLVVAGCQIPVMTMGASRTTKLLGMDLDPRLTLNVAASKQCAATSQRISQLRCIAHKEAGPSPHDLRTFVIGYGASKLRYGSELIWAVATDSAKKEMQKTYAPLTRNPPCWTRICRLFMSFSCTRVSPYSRTHQHVRWTGCGDLRLSLCPRRFPHPAVISRLTLCICG
ncbi:hypothetical protein ECC02_012527 [Trypanosoma cruzi]|uniref:Uncharacterized protein n=1 Tax=Trypanosoma cruzi TaxID=5693 RepID=A0A7J6XJY2_TRYCR|nr:hypothetical protein ECC02_012527 [Trypanosoma cruzi]